jgi:hypothetical protein
MGFVLLIYKEIRPAEFQMQLKSTLLEGSRGLHISESAVRISYTFR